MRTTCDTLLDGRLHLEQPARGQGYRFNLDPVLLADFAPRAAHVVDLGAGCGVLGALLLHAGKAQRVTAVEIQAEMAALCRDNAERNGFGSRMSVVSADLRHIQLADVDGVVFNPPYFAAERGRGSPNSLRDAARHERHGTLVDFVSFCARHRLPGKPFWAAAVIRTERCGELEEAFRHAAMFPRRLRLVLSRLGAKPHLAMLEASYLPGERRVLTSLALHRQGTRAFTSEVGRLVTMGPG